MNQRRKQGTAAKRVDGKTVGIAKVVDPDSGEVAKTTTGAIVGTPIYMSPEQCRGGITMTDRTDVYSLGIILYQMLSGNPPFSGTGAGDLIAQHIIEQPKPLHEVAPHVSTEVETLVHKMLAKKPEERPSMKQILSELEQLGLLATGTGAQVVIVQPPPPQEPPKRSIVPLIGAGAALLLAGLALGGLTLQKNKPQPASATMVPASATMVPASATTVPASATTTPAPQPATVRLSLRSEPPGAQVVQVTDQAVLGLTPWSVERARSPETLKVVLRLAGYAEQTVVIDQNEPYDRTVSLVRQTPSVEPSSDKQNAQVNQQPEQQGNSVAKPIAKPVQKPVWKAPVRPVQRPATRPQRDVDDIPVVR